MAYYDEIWDMAADNHGVVTAADARRAGVSGRMLTHLVGQGRLRRVARGVYRVTAWVPTPLDQFAEAVAAAGEGAYLWGESVLAMHDLALVNPSRITVATPRRVRRRLPAWVVLVPDDGTGTSEWEGIPAQSVADAIRACKRSVEPDRLADATLDARKQGLITETEKDELLGDLEG